MKKVGTKLQLDMEKKKKEDNVLGVRFNGGRGYLYNVPDQSGKYLPESRIRTRQGHAADSGRS